jgi:AAA family ATP:ADP antiporter
LPYAKIAFVIFLIPLILIYSKLVDIFKKQTLVYFITTSYGIFFLFVALLLLHPTIGLENAIPHKYRILGWAIYLGVESFISLVITLFWSFVASITETSSAKRGYPLILAGAQIGTIAGPEFAKHATQIGIPTLVIIAACGIFMVPLMLALFIKSHPQITAVPKSLEPATGLTEGLRLLLTKPYLLGILGIATLGDIVVTILEYEFLYKTKHVYQSTEKITEFLGLYGQSANTLTLLLSLVGTSFIMRKYGLTFSLMVYPIAVGTLVCCVWSFPTLWVLFAAMVTIKCLSYALNGPCKEIMYIPTSKDIKFKAKGWIDTIGHRLAQGMGGTICALFPLITNLIFFGSIISLGVVAVWIKAASYVGRKNHHLVSNGKIID